MASNGYHHNNGFRNSLEAGDAGVELEGDQPEEIIDLRRNGAHDLDNKYNGFIMIRDGDVHIGEDVDSDPEPDPERDSIEEEEGEGDNRARCDNNVAAMVSSSSCSVAGNSGQMPSALMNNKNEGHNGTDFDSVEEQQEDEEEEDMDVDDEDEEEQESGIAQKPNSLLGQDLKCGSDVIDSENILDSVGSDEIESIEENKDVDTEKDTVGKDCSDLMESGPYSGGDDEDIVGDENIQNGENKGKSPMHQQQGHGHSQATCGGQGDDEREQQELEKFGSSQKEVMKEETIEADDTGNGWVKEGGVSDGQEADGDVEQEQLLVGGYTTTDQIAAEAKSAAKTALNGGGGGSEGQYYPSTDISGLAHEKGEKEGKNRSNSRQGIGGCVARDLVVGETEEEKGHLLSQQPHLLETEERGKQHQALSEISSSRSTSSPPSPHLPSVLSIEQESVSAPSLSSPVSPTSHPHSQPTHGNSTPPGLSFPTTTTNHYHHHNHQHHHHEESLQLSNTPLANYSLSCHTSVPTEDNNSGGNRGLQSPPSSNTALTDTSKQQEEEVVDCTLDSSDPLEEEGQLQQEEQHQQEVEEELQEHELEEEDSFIGNRSSSAETLELVDRSLTPPALSQTTNPYTTTTTVTSASTYHTSPSSSKPSADCNYLHGEQNGLSNPFLDYLHTRMERTNSTEEEKRDAEKLSEMEVVAEHTACHGEELSEAGSCGGPEPASAAAPTTTTTGQESDPCSTNASEALLPSVSSSAVGKTGGEEEADEDDEKDVDTSDNACCDGGENANMVVKESVASNEDDGAGAASGKTEQVEGEAERQDDLVVPSQSVGDDDQCNSSTLENNTAELINLDNKKVVEEEEDEGEEEEDGVDAADKDVTDEKGPSQEESGEGCFPSQPCTRAVELVDIMEVKPEEEGMMEGQQSSETQKDEDQTEQETPAAAAAVEGDLISVSEDNEDQKDGVRKVEEDQTEEDKGTSDINPSMQQDLMGGGDEEGVKAEEVHLIEAQHESPPEQGADEAQEEVPVEQPPPEASKEIEPQAPADQGTTLVDFSEPALVEEEEAEEEKKAEPTAEKEEEEAGEEKESDEEVNTFIEHPSPNVEEEEQHVPEETKPTTVAKSEEPTTPSGDVVRADDKVDDGIDSVPSIGNIKSRFQEHDERPPMPGERSSFGKSTNGHVNGDHTPPEVVNRSESQEEILERELPPANLARNMASRFRDMESDGPVERKPVRKITPPREEVERDVTYVRESLDRDPNVVRSDTSAEKEDERPPPSFTKNMLAKFKEMEDTTNPPPSPARSAISPTKRTAISHQQFATYTRASPDEGIADTEPSETNGHRAEVIREGDKSETEELPERGFTKSLLAQWRQIESTAPTESAKSLAPRQTTPGRGGSYRQASPSNSQDEDGNREVVRGGDSNEEEFLPPPSYTKNMLAKFQTLQDESTTDQGSASSKKQFKWEVREAKPLWGGVPSRVQLSPEAVTNGHEGNGEVFSSDEEQEEEYIDETELECDEYGNPIYPINHPRHPDNVHRRREKRSSSSQREVVRSGESAEPEEELPAPETTRRLLSQFKSMEDVAAPVPTPERVAQQQRLLRSSSSGGQQQSDRRTSQASEEREQPDGTDNLDYPLQSEQHYEDSGEYENNPVYREDVVRETDQDENEDLPEQGITRNLLAKFQSMQAV